jgi:hypothetical protein
VGTIARLPGRPRRYGLCRRRGRCSGDHSSTACLWLWSYC